MAIKSQGALLRVSTADGASKTITAITAANPPVVTSAAHGLANGSIVLISGVVGMTQVNNRAFHLENQATNTFELAGVDGTGYSAYTSGGTALVKTMSTIGEVAGVSGFDGVADEIDVTNLQSTAKEFLIGLQDFGNLTMEVNLANTDVGQIKLRNLKAAATIGYFAITLSDTKVSAFAALVRSFTFSNPQNDAARGSVQLRITGEPQWFS
jgi:hypothetical protein